jgi:hypothetical protein
MIFHVLLGSHIAINLAPSSLFFPFKLHSSPETSVSDLFGVHRVSSDALGLIEGHHTLKKAGEEGSFYGWKRRPNCSRVHAIKSSAVLLMKARLLMIR